jgi:diadenosine tetraphosphatase ApaH/serine/threonine PP2A family protein phosphatase
VTRFSGGRAVFELICQCFDALPICATVNDTVFCVHGGISPNFTNLDKFDYSDLIWSDPQENIDGFTSNNRKAGYFFSKRALADFLDSNGLRMMIRAHSYTPRGYNWNFGLDGRCLTLFSSTGYEGKNNLGAVAIITEGSSEVKTDVMAPMTPEILAHRRILFPTWAITDGSELIPFSMRPQTYPKLVI